jgi:hypothetical protein
VEAVSFWLEGNTILAVLDYVSTLGMKTPVMIEVSSLYRLKEVVKEAFDKATIQGDYQDEVEGGFEGFIQSCKAFNYHLEGRELSGPLAISVDFYHRSTGHFLFGTPSQLRIKMPPMMKNYFSDTQSGYPP